MLLQFNFKNFKSFRDDTTLDLTTAKISEYGNHVVSIGGEKALPVAAIFGANGSGKSNVLEAFRYMADYVTNPLGYREDEPKNKIKPLFLSPTPFLFDSSSKDAESSFEVYFIPSEANGAKSYNYGFTVNRNGITEEWLNYKSRTSRGNYRRIFYRNGTELDLRGLEPKCRKNLRAVLGKKSLIVSLGSRLRIAKLELVYDWFKAHEFADLGQPVENFFRPEQLPDDFASSKDVQGQVAKYLSAFDPSIIGFEADSVECEGLSKIRIGAIHKMIDSENTAIIPLKSESAGTLKMFALYSRLQRTLETGGVLFVDELDARLHPLLVRAFAITFANPGTNPNHAQLVFTSYEPWLLEATLLRRDEIWFVEKASNGVSSLYSLADFVDDDGMKIRKDENYEKNYMLGKYGAIPTMQLFDFRA